MNIDSLKILYGLVSNPETKDMKLKSYESLIYGTFLYKNSSNIKEKDIKDFAKINYLKTISDLILTQVITQLKNQNKIKIEDDQIKLVDEEQLKLFEQQKFENENKMKNFNEFMISKLQNYFEEPFNNADVEAIISILNKIITEIMDSYSDSVVDLYNGKLISTKRENIEIIISKIIEEDESLAQEFANNLKSSLLKVFKNQFNDPDKKFAYAIRLYALRYIMSKIIIKNPSMDSVKKDLFKDAKIYIDTNILIYLLCKSSRLYDITNDLIIETNKLGGKVLVSEWTLEEFRTSVDTAKHLYKKIKEGKIKPLEVDSDIINTYCEIPTETKNWIDFIIELNVNLENFLKSDLIKSDSCPAPEKTTMEKLKNIINQEYLNKGIYKRYSLILHDAQMMLHIQNSREKKDLTIGTFWFLTADERLRRIEQKNLSKLGFYSEGLISCDIWFEMLLPFIDLEYDEEEISKSFSKLLGVNLIPLSKDLVDSYIQHLKIQLDLEDDDVNKIKKRIETVHVKNTLENAICSEDFFGANLIIKETLEESKDKEKLKKTIRELKTQLTKFKTDGHLTFFKTDKLSELTEKVITSKEPNEKGKTLENLTKYIFENINGLIFIDRDIRLEAEEIDLVFSNGVFLSWGDPIVIECKNWSEKIGNNEVVVFINKLKKMDAKTGILVTFEGITGTEYKDAILSIREALSEGIHIIVLLGKDLKNLNKGEEFIELLEKRFYFPTKYISP